MFKTKKKKGWDMMAHDQKSITKVYYKKMILLSDVIIAGYTRILLYLKREKNTKQSELRSTFC